MLSFAHAADSKLTGSKYNFEKEVKPILQKFCYDCHDEDVMKGDVQLDNLDPDIVKGKDGGKWHAALDVINTSDMPPKKKKQPSDQERRILVDWITDNIKLARKINKGKVQSVVRRLTREQYQNAINDILGIKLDVAKSLPSDSPSGMGFINDGATQFASPLLLETYQEIARMAIKKAIGPAEKPPITRYKVDFGKDISKQKNSQKGGYQSIALSGHDFIPYVLDEKGNILPPDAKTETGKKVSDVAKTISIGMRGSEGGRYFSANDALVMYGANPQPNRAPQAWRAPNPNAKLLVRHEFPHNGNFKFTIEASKADLKIDKYFVDPLIERKGRSNNKYPAQISWVNGKLNKAPGTNIIPASAFKLNKNLTIVDNAVKPKKGDRGDFKISFKVPKDGYYQIDMARKKIKSIKRDTSIHIKSDIYGAKSFSLKLAVTRDSKIKDKEANTVNQLLHGYIKAGTYTVTISHQLPPITHIAVTELSGKALDSLKSTRDKIYAERDSAVKHYENTPGVLRTFLGCRGDDGENYKFIDGLREVNGKAGEKQTLVYKGRLENYPLPVVDPKNTNGLSGIMVLGFYNHHLAPKVGGIGPAVNVHSITFEAPYFEMWPTKSYRSIFASAKPKSDLESTRKVISTFMNKAFRKKVPTEQVEKYVKFWQAVKGDYDRYEDGVAEVLIAILCSPEFIYIAEPPADKSAKKVDEFQLANRLSFLLWNRAPDSELLKVANQGQLTANLDKQIDRLLNDKRSKGFIQSFGSQWLKMERFATIDLDKKLLGKFNPHIRAYMIEETHSFLKHILDNNLSIKNFVDSDFVMLNEHLANYYGIQDVHGHQFRPVKVDRNLNRGGLISQGSFLIGNSDGKQSHPIKRGVWLMEKIMATEPPPPPPNVPEIDESIPGFDKMSMAQKLEVHRDKASCRDCHQKIDPWGLAFEEYDALGQFHAGGQKASSSKNANNVGTVISIKDSFLKSKAGSSRIKFDAVSLAIPGKTRILNISELEI